MAIIHNPLFPLPSAGAAAEGPFSVPDRLRGRTPWLAATGSPPPPRKEGKGSQTRGMTKRGIPVVSLAHSPHPGRWGGEGELETQIRGGEICLERGKWNFTFERKKCSKKNSCPPARAESAKSCKREEFPNSTKAPMKD